MSRNCCFLEVLFLRFNHSQIHKVQGESDHGVQGSSGTSGAPQVQYHPNATWMPAPMVVPLNFPPGLEHLSQIDQILIHRQLELLESGFEGLRAFTIRIFNNLGQEVIELRRPFRDICRCCCCCFLQELEVHAPPGTPAGYIKENWQPWLPKFSVQNEAKEHVLKMFGPCIGWGCSHHMDQHYEVTTRDEQHMVGRISNQLDGLVQEFFRGADLFRIQFPMDLDIKMKAIMIGAGFLVGITVFEQMHRLWWW
ncbi:phospholipid scramblase 1-like isoform X2 [Hemicordylus capensis]|uniref:phospholipid scramblase 1-like isoform X2 n=1 Tax=Hemicordylus capensis TaxID=884348 RepID=UPI0023047E10|nr:phospholipid scramblase 1-like isoform X2 [Hemicordylus capensis]